MGCGDAAEAGYRKGRGFPRSDRRTAGKNEELRRNRRHLQLLAPRPCRADKGRVRPGRDQEPRLGPGQVKRPQPAGAGRPAPAFYWQLMKFSEQLTQYVLSGFATGAIYSLIGLGFAII